MLITLLVVCAVVLSGCGTVEGILRYITSLPNNLFNAVAP